jgi:hypothetical protein
MFSSITLWEGDGNNKNSCHLSYICSHHDDLILGRFSGENLQRLCEIQLNFIDETPAPVLARLDGPHDRVLCHVEVFRGVLVLRVVTASHVSTDHAEPQMHPCVAHFHAFFAYMNLGLPNLDLIHVCTRWR